MVLSLSITSCLPLSLFLSQYWSSRHLSKLSQRHSLKLPYLPPSAWLILNIVATEAWCHRPTSRPKLPISLKPTPSSTSDPCCRSPQTHFSFVFSLSSFLASIGSHITRLASNRSILFCFALIINVYDHWSMIGAGLVSWYRIRQSIGHGFRFGCVDFFGFLFCSSSLVLMARRGCGCVMIFMGLIWLWLCVDGWMKYYFIVLKAKIAPLP